MCTTRHTHAGVTKGGVVERIMKHVTGRGSSQLPDFVFCCGDDRSDEDMFRAVERLTASKKGGQTEVRRLSLSALQKQAVY